jgi:hypothetical protein
MKMRYLLFLLIISFRFASAQQRVEDNKVEQADSGRSFRFKNVWTEAPKRTPSDVSADGPLQGNGDVTMTLSSTENGLRYYLTKNDFWRLRSQADGLSGPRVAAFFDININSFNNASFHAEQSIRNGLTTCVLKKGDSEVITKSWVSATQNLIFIELSTPGKPVKVSLGLSAPENKYAVLKTGTDKNNIYWQSRSFNDSVDVKTNVAVALKCLNYSGNEFTLEASKKALLVISLVSNFNNSKPVEQALKNLQSIDNNIVKVLFREHNGWWNQYWSKSSVTLEDTTLLKAWYQGLYTMGACSRNKQFPPAIFGWITTDSPAWNGDYHLNYNFQAPFYSLYKANHTEQGSPQDEPLLNFMARGELYARKVTNTRGVLYPVGIGPLGIEPTRNFAIGGYQKPGDIEYGGLFYGQRSNAAYGLINMAEQWRCTYDIAYGKKIYPYALAVVRFWEDYLKFENGRYVIYNDAIHEGSGKNMNPILSLGLIKNSFELMIDLSKSLKTDQQDQAKWQNILNKLSSFPVQFRQGKKVFRYTEEGLAWWDDNGLGIQHIYPCNAINLDSDTSLLNTARNTIDEMHRWKDVNTSNSFFMAAIRVGYDKDIVYKELQKYAIHTFPNGFQLNNPHGIENSCTVVNAVDEMLCSSAGNVIRLFSGLPKNKNASFSNLREWGAFLVSAQLKNGAISDVRIKSEKGKPCTLVNPWPGAAVKVIRNGKLSETVQGERFTIASSPNEMIELVNRR